MLSGDIQVDAVHRFNLISRRKKVSNLIYCRGCGAQIHETATSCPKCGAMQVQTSKANLNDHTALSITSCVLGVVVLIGAFGVDAPWDRDEVVGTVFLVLIASICGGLSLHQEKPSKSTAVIGLVTAGIGLLICIGNF